MIEIQADNADKTIIEYFTGDLLSAFFCDEKH